MTRDKYDVIVVGAGPARCIVARKAAAQCDVLFIEKTAGDRGTDKVRRRRSHLAIVRFSKVIKEYVEPDPRLTASEVWRIRATSSDGTTVEVSADTFGAEGPLGCIIERTLFF